MNRFFAKIVTSLYVFGKTAFPNDLSESEIRVANHIRGAKFSISINTDDLQTFYPKMLMWTYENNFKTTLFYEYGTNNTLATNLYNTGLIDIGIYTRLNNAPYNGLTSDPVDFTAFDNMITNIESNITSGKEVTTVAYGNGIDTYKQDLLTRLLGGRNSRHANDTYQSPPKGSNNLIDVLEYENLTDVDLISRPSSNRWLYYSAMIPSKPSFYSGTFNEGKSDFKRKIQNAKRVNGWYSAFGHWHWSAQDYYKRYLQYLNSLINGLDVYKGNYSEMTEYYFVKSSVDSIKRIGSSVIINYTKKYPNSPYNKINTKLWLEFNTIGTHLEGKDIETDIPSEIIKKADNIFAIGVSLDFNNTSLSFKINETITPSYLVLTKPVVTFDSGTDAINSDQNITYTLFRKAKSEKEKDVVIIEYETTESTSHSLTGIDQATYDYYLGYKNKAGTTGVLKF